jgi:hypothetical protein
MALLTFAYWAFGWWSALAWALTLVTVSLAWLFRWKGLALGVGIIVSLSILGFFIAKQKFDARAFESEIERNIQSDGFGFLLIAELNVLVLAVVGSLVAIALKNNRPASGTIGK